MLINSMHSMYFDPINYSVFDQSVPPPPSDSQTQSILFESDVINAGSISTDTVSKVGVLRSARPQLRKKL